MAADDFTITPTWVYPIRISFNNVITVSESLKKDYQNIADIPTERFRIVWRGLSDANAELIYEHYKSRYAGYDDFAWKAANIPSYINDILDLGGADLTGRWIDESWKATPKANSWDIELIFEKAQ